VQDERHAHGLVGPARELRARSARGGRQLRAPHAREIDAAPLEHRAVFQNARQPAAAFGSAPGIASEFSAVSRFERADDPLLQLLQVSVDRGGVVHR